jgi:hypothetical protein
MHVHISWATALVTILSWVATVGAVNLLARAYPGSRFARGWSLVSSAN